MKASTAGMPTIHKESIAQREAHTTLLRLEKEYGVLLFFDELVAKPAGRFFYFSDRG